jgi:hypothetical protein
VTAGNYYQINITNLIDDVYMYAYDNDSTFTTWVDYSDNSGTADESVTIQASGSTIYFLVVGYPSTTGSTYDVVITDLGTGYSAEGSIASPVVLSVGTTHNGTVNKMSSFYQAAVTAGTLYEITVTNMVDDVDLWVYDNDSTFTTWVDWSTNIGTADESLTILASGNTMYIETYGYWTSVGSSYDILIAEPTNATVDGTVTIPSAAPGAVWLVFIDDDTNFANGTIEEIMGVCGASTAIDFTIYNVPAGTFYLYAAVDVDNSMGFSNGDYLGFYGGTDTNPPSSANATVPSSGTVTFDFSLGTFFLSGTTYYIETFPNGSGSDADTVLLVYNDSMNMISFNDDKLTDYYSEVEVPLESGKRYYIQVADEYDDGDFYSIRISDTGFGGSSSGTASDPDSYEPDNDSSSATELILNVVQDHSLSFNGGAYGDEDWFYFDVP